MVALEIEVDRLKGLWELGYGATSYCNDQGLEDCYIGVLYKEPPIEIEHAHTQWTMGIYVVSGDIAREEQDQSGQA